MPEYQYLGRDPDTGLMIVGYGGRRLLAQPSGNAMLAIGDRVPVIEGNPIAVAFTPSILPDEVIVEEREVLAPVNFAVLSLNTTTNRLYIARNVPSGTFLAEGDMVALDDIAFINGGSAIREAMLTVRGKDDPEYVVNSLISFAPQRFDDPGFAFYNFISTATGSLNDYLIETADFRAQAPPTDFDISNFFTPQYYLNVDGHNTVTITWATTFLSQIQSWKGGYGENIVTFRAENTDPNVNNLLGYVAPATTALATESLGFAASDFINPASPSSSLVRNFRAYVAEVGGTPERAVFEDLFNGGVFIGGLNQSISLTGITNTELRTLVKTPQYVEWVGDNLYYVEPSPTLWGGTGRVIHLKMEATGITRQSDISFSGSWPVTPAGHVMLSLKFEF